MIDISATIDAMWTKFEADSALSTLLAKGTTYKYEAGKLIKVLDLKPANCPALALYPATDAGVWAPAFNARQPLADQLGVVIEGATAGHDFRQITALAGHVRRVLAANIRAGLGLVHLGPEQIDYQGLTWIPRPSENDLIEMWLFQVTAVCTYRIV